MTRAGGRSPNIKNRVDEATEQAVQVYAVDQPAHGQHRTSNELRKKGCNGLIILEGFIAYNPPKLEH